MSDIVIKNGYSIHELEKIEEIKDLDQENKKRYIGLSWPIVYIMYNKKKKKIYIGQTTNAFRRMKEHRREEIIQKNKLEDILIIYSKEANLSIAVNLENYLIRVLGAEKTNKIINKNNSFSHEYYKKESYEEDMKEIWSKLRKENIVDKNLEEIKKLELYKLSPFVELSRNQSKIISSVKDIIINEEKTRNIVINGIPGTGKTIMALYLAKDLKDYYDEKNKPLKIGIITPLNQFNKTLKEVVRKINVFDHIKILSPVEAVNDYDKTNQKFDILIIDEAHRLKFCKDGQTVTRYREICKSLGLAENNNVEHINQLDWLEKIGNKRIILFDEFQSIREEDLKKKDLEKRIGIKIDNKEKSNYFILKEPMRIKVDNYIDYIDELLQISKNRERHPKSDFFPEYELYMTKNLKELENILKNKKNSRLVAGYAWEWKTQERTKKQKKAQNYKKFYDFEEYFYKGEYTRENLTGKEADFKKKWNRSNSNGWCNTEVAKKLDEIGCVHTIQGYDVDYIGILFGREIVYRNGKIKVNREEYKDKGGYSSKIDDKELTSYIKNIYRILMSRGIKGTYIYVFDKQLREYLENYLYYWDERNR